MGFWLMAESKPDKPLDRGAPTEQRIRGYRVKVTWQKLDPAVAEAKRQAIAAIIARSLKKT